MLVQNKILSFCTDTIESFLEINNSIGPEAVCKKIKKFPSLIRSELDKRFNEKQNEHVVGTGKVVLSACFALELFCLCKAETLFPFLQKQFNEKNNKEKEFVMKECTEAEKDKKSEANNQENKDSEDSEDGDYLSRKRKRKEKSHQHQKSKKYQKRRKQEIEIEFGENEKEIEKLSVIDFLSQFRDWVRKEVKM
jgi:hypothetical protein